ncbi:hypothetical protein HYC85_024156 [Camellia sinensis]|uniref:Cytochrome c oxidase subunit 5C n=1 Tax=Camellia sinensis TaxID=4442 RepID=A0A7J7G798_CAMSI|nr:hypothetical protein HYC85_024156 [Camellia sinensis]
MVVASISLASLRRIFSTRLFVPYEYRVLIGCGYVYRYGKRRSGTFGSFGYAMALQTCKKGSKMAAHKVAHATLTGPSVIKELVIGLTLGLAAGGLWKMHHWNEQRKVRAFYNLLEKGEISVVAEE